MDIEQLRKEQRQITEKIDAIFDKADAEQRQLSQHENEERAELETKYEELGDQAKQLEAEQKARERQESRRREQELLERSPGRQTRAEKVGEGNIGKVKLAAEDDVEKRGFKDHREFLEAVMEHGQSMGHRYDERLKLLAAGSDEQSTFADPYGGFLLPKGFSPNLLTVDPEVDPVAGRTTMIPMAEATLEIPARVDKDHSSSVSGGLQVYRRAEGDTSSSTRMEVEQVQLRAHMLFGLAYATEELLERSPISFIALLEAGFGDEMAAKILDERINGSGVGMYEGILNAPATVSVGAETGQAANTIVYENVINMRARCWRYGNAIWLANHDTLPQLMQLSQTVGTGGVPAWQPSAREGEPDMLLGQPIFFSEFAKSLGNQGDLILGNWREYLEGTLNPTRSAESVHVRFTNHERTFKFWQENDGRCWWRSALTPRESSDTLSPFVVLDART